MEREGETAWLYTKKITTDPLEHKYFTEMCRAISFSKWEKLGKAEHYVKDPLLYSLHFPQTDSK